MTVVIGEKRRTPAPGWFCDVDVDGERFEVGVVVIDGDITPRPRVFGMISDADGHRVWEGEIPAATTARQMLVMAGLAG